tara:strand:- start:401 stop:988 length:588 start_codon:yes stop_codon:yes gene_type:complete
VKGNIKFIVKEISLKNKPKEMLEISPKGTVPILITNNGSVIDESLEIMKWSLTNSNRLDIYRDSDAEKKKKINLLIGQNDTLFKKHLDRFKYSSRYLYVNKEREKLMAREILIYWNSLIFSNARQETNGWLVDKNESLADWAIWPFVRQYKNVDNKWFENEPKIQSLNKWLNYFISSKFYLKVMEKVNLNSLNKE